MHIVPGPADHGREASEILNAGIELKSLLHSDVVLRELCRRLRPDHEDEPTLYRLEITSAELDHIFGQAEDEADYRISAVRERLA